MACAPNQTQVLDEELNEVADVIIACRLIVSDKFMRYRRDVFRESGDVS
jgi:hypothetical protein